MEHRASSILFFFFLALFLVFFSSPSSVSAFNITKILEKQSDFSNFNNLLSQTKLADEINRRSTITILAVDNGGVGGLSGQSSDMAKKILSVHVVLDYYDQDKLKKIFKSNKSATLTTLFQSTAKGGNGNSVNFVKSVVSQPYNISVLQVGSIINVPDIESSSSGHASAPNSAKAPSPSKSKKNDSDDEAPSPSNDESSSDKAPAPSKHKGKDKENDNSSPPVSADSPSESTAPTPSAPAPSAASRTREIMAVGAGVVIMGLVSLLAA
ncbi:fasciclin-like arabinogalactan protein 14 [Prunus yedoensis var. nudiflora]|uniref:Fasciclin-like arabinogalactan protein 14 n=1 Tax=Prunus yedoensis var. nudiflora TaxID=2094558 RepID=A0A314UUG0_PRUYE|nr:fasciclin-like arabinogalactan protein 14 [Prunus yedoensis var. nudiflora]